MEAMRDHMSKKGKVKVWSQYLCIGWCVPELVALFSDDTPFSGRSFSAPSNLRRHLSMCEGSQKDPGCDIDE